MHTEPMTNKRFTFTIDLHPESAHEAEDIFDAVQLLLADEFGGEAEASFGSPDELVDGDDLVAAIAPRDVSHLTTEQMKKLLNAIFTGEGTTPDDDEDTATPYSLRVSFVASRVLSRNELNGLEAAIAAQVEEPSVINEEGHTEDADYHTSDVVVDVEGV